MLTFNSEKKFNFRSIAIAATIAAGLASSMVSTANAADPEALEGSATTARAMPAEPTYTDVYEMATCETARLTLMNIYDARIRVLAANVEEGSDSVAAQALVAVSADVSAESESSAAAEALNWLAPGASRVFEVPEASFLAGRIQLGGEIFNFAFSEDKAPYSNLRTLAGTRKASQGTWDRLWSSDRTWVLIAGQEE